MYGRASGSKVRRDLNVSLALLVAGVIVFVVAEVAFSFQQHNTTWMAFQEEVVVQTGSTFILVGAVFAIWNWKILRRSSPPR